MSLVKNVKIIDSKKLRERKELLKKFSKEARNKQTININQFVTVELTDIGRQQLINFNKQFNPEFKIDIYVKEDGTYRTQLHELMLEFGGVKYESFKPPFKNCKINIE